MSGSSRSTPATRSSARAGSSSPEGVERARRRPRWRPASSPAGVACGLKGGGATDVGVVVCDAAPSVALGDAADRATPRRRRRSGSAATSATPGAIARRRRQLGQRQRRDRRAGLPRRARDARRGGRRRSASTPRAVAVAETGVIGVPLQIDAVLGGHRRARPARLSDARRRASSRGDHDHRRGPEALRGAAPAA